MWIGSLHCSGASFCCLVTPALSRTLNYISHRPIPPPSTSAPLSLLPHPPSFLPPYHTPPSLTNKAVTCHISQEATQISNQHHKPDLAQITFQYHAQHARTHTHTHTHNTMTYKMSHTITTPPHLHTNVPESCPPFRSCSLILILGVPFKTWAKNKEDTCNYHQGPYQQPQNSS